VPDPQAPTGSPFQSSSSVSSTSAPKRLKTSRSDDRLGFSPTFVIETSDPVMAAAGDGPERG
jgi:hypothetical protein